jgi:hypothetical protein
MKLKIKTCFEIVLALIALSSAISAIRSCQIAEDSKIIAEKTLESSDKQFVQLNRPYLTLSPVKYDDGTYYKITEKDQKLIIELSLELKNSGNVAAKNVTFPNAINIKTKMTLNGIYKITPIMSLSPEDSIKFSIAMHIDFNDQNDLPLTIEKLNSSEYKGIEMGCTVTYENEMNETNKYACDVQYRIKKDRAIILKLNERQFSS